MGYPPASSADTTSVSTPEPTYYWIVGQVGYCTKGNGPCPKGALNTVQATQVYNGFGYDAVGYPADAVTYYRTDVPGMPFPCGYDLYQGMANYCKLTSYWRPYASNDLSGTIETGDVVDCKNEVCATIYQ